MYVCMYVCMYVSTYVLPADTECTVSPFEVSSVHLGEGF